MQIHMTLTRVKGQGQGQGVRKVGKWPFSKCDSSPSFDRIESITTDYCTIMPINQCIWGCVKGDDRHPLLGVFIHSPISLVTLRHEKVT
jgi:hypothetical protein